MFSKYKLDRLSLSPLHEIPRNRWNVLRDLYVIYWPRHILSYYTLKTCIEWTTHNPSLDITIYTSDENWQKHGTYVIVVHSGEHCDVLFNTLTIDKNHDLLLKTFQCLPVNRTFTLAAFVLQLQPIAEKYLGNEQFTTTQICDTLLFYLPKKQSLQLPIEDKLGYHFKNLSLDDVPLIDSLWPHRYPGSDILIENIIRCNLTLGAYDERTGKLCGWVLQDEVGTIGFLHVEDPFRRFGIGEQLLIQMAMLYANAGMDAIATVLSTNRPSRHLFHKLGFKIIDRIFWYDAMPVKQPTDNNRRLTVKSTVIDSKQRY